MVILATLATDLSVYAVSVFKELLCHHGMRMFNKIYTHSVLSYVAFVRLS